MSGDLGRRMDEYTKIQQAAGLDSEQAAKRSKEFMNALTQLQATIEAVVTKVLTDLEPTLTEKLNALSKWFVDHKEDIKSFIIAVSQAIEGLIEDLGKLIEAFKPVFKTFDDMAKSLTGKDGLQAAFEAFAVFLAMSWLLRVLGVFNGVKIGWLALAALVGFAPTSIEQSKSNGDAINDAIGGTGVFKWWNNNVRNPVRKMFGLDPADARGNTSVNAADAGKPLSSSQRDRNAAETYQMLRNAGLSREAALGVVANEDAESGFNPKSTGDGGQAKGAFQWHPDRQAAIFKGTGIDVTDPNTAHADHVRGMLWEMQHSDDAGARKAWRLLKDAQTPAEAAAIFTQFFERPADLAGQSRSRGTKANTWATRIPVDGPSRTKAPQVANQNGGLHPAFDWAKNASANLGAINSPAPLGAGGNTSNSNVSLKQETNISVIGGGNPQDTASAVANRQNSVNSLMLRNTQGAVR
ncbi:hypothetical protein G6L15_08620 [Agrobacterium rhizogenes]|uniref:phage tail tip lysozyme n=1 Tax=Rhizobium rhizogenes TaxID=359 RepID=UPI001572FE86|nr:phage tail tip lysozyme [Rhizobium rhizogenes]NTG86208.1 hypothetical protein [Rhizobium rhizogenes]